jgi:hypothetical protein
LALFLAGVMSSRNLDAAGQHLSICSKCKFRLMLVEDSIAGIADTP